MSSAGAILLIVTGLAIMALGLLLFYAWLPFLYGFVGFDIGLLLGRWLTGDVGIIAIILGAIGAVVLAFASYSLEPYRRILLGVSAGVLIGLALAAGFGLSGTIGTLIGGVLAVVFGLIGGNVVPRYFDLFVIFASAVAIAPSTSYPDAPPATFFGGIILFYVLYFAIYIFAVVFSIIGAVKAFKGQPFHYPLMGRI